MSVIVRGAKNAFRNTIRTSSIVLILAISVGLALSMLLANQAVKQKITDLKTQVGTTALIRPAGSQDFQGGGEPLTNDDVTQVKSVAHAASVDAVDSFMLTTEGADTGTVMFRGPGGSGKASGQTSLTSPIDAGTLGKRFSASSDNGDANATPPALPIQAEGISGDRGSDGSTIKITSGRALNSSDNDAAIVGQDLATKNNLKVGSTFTAYGETFTVVGIFDQGTKFANAGLAIPLSTAQRLTGQTNEVSVIVAQADSIDNLDGMISAIKSKLGSNKADVTSTQTSVTDAINSLQSVQSISVIGFIMALAAAAVIIFLTMLMIVRERRREIGVLKAIGGSNRSVVAQFMVEAIVLVFMGAVVGLGISVVASNSIVSALISSNTTSTTPQEQGPNGNASFGGGQRMVRFGGANFGGKQNAASLVKNITTAIGWTTIVYCFLSALAIAIVGSAIPALFIAKVRPAEVMRGE